MHENEHSPAYRRGQMPRLVALCLGGLMLNFMGMGLSFWWRLPLSLNNLGTILVAALGGLLPGVVVGFITNLVSSLTAAVGYSGSMAVLIAVATALMARYGYFSRLSRMPLAVLVLASLGGILGTVLNELLQETATAADIAAPLAVRFIEGGVLNPFWARLLVNFLLDLADKSVCVLVVAILFRVLPENLRQSLQVFHILLGKSAEQPSQTRRASVRARLILLVGMTTLISVITVTGISFVHFRNAAVAEQATMATGVATVLSDLIDPERVDEFIEQGEAAPGYLETEAKIKLLMESTESIEYCYVYRILEDGCHVVFDPDTEDMPGSEPGEVIEFDDAFLHLLPQLLAGEPIDPVISDDTYGWLLSIYKPVYDSEGKCQCYAAVDINMKHIADSGQRFLTRVVTLFFGFFLLILAIAIWMAETNLIRPINSMARTTGRFAFDSQEERDAALKSIQELDIRTGDEIENLYHAVVRTTEDMVAYIANMQHQSEVISKLQNGLILVLADLVESRDQCTGDHVRKTAAYTKIIMDELKKEGVYTEYLTDAYMKDVENSAPLHDVGKIQVPDAILNKPGKLTDEEFAIMKSHTTAGSEIISRAMAKVSEEDSGYLKEARNLAHYHHEKWNGMGYPEGLKGEEIPLSARIMAVADVFDALVSRRPYKQGFPFEKAMAIIEEGSGSHFDPNVAGAFLRASDEVRRLMNTNMSD